jgi:PAS domain S-box-containing protein/putative nucleotidyltransferase with HDIG domain
MGLILIAFERESEQTAIEQLLAKGKHRINKAANGLAALDAARREPPDLVISDIVLPRMDGFALCRKWKQDERLQRVPFIFYTRRHDDPKYERFALELGAERFLPRSVTPDSLCAAVDELLASGSAKLGATAPLPALNEEAIKRVQADESARAEALQRATQAQERMRAQLAEVQASHQRLSAGEARFRMLFEENPLPMWIADKATQGFIAVNNSALTTYGYARNEFLALKASALVAPAQDEDTGVTMHRRKDGSVIAAALAIRDIEFDGRSAQLVCAVDLTERVAFEQQIQQKAATGRAVLDAAPDGCLILDGDGNVLDVNTAYCRLSGHSRDALLKMRGADLEDQSSGETTLRLQLGRVRGGGRYETKHRRADGSLLDVEVSMGSLENSRGDTIMLVRDVAQRRREQVTQRLAQRQLQFIVDLMKQSEQVDESTLVARVLEQALEISESPLAFVYFVDAPAKTMQLVAWRDRNQPHAVMAQSESKPLTRAGVFTECVRARHPTSSNDLARKPQQDGLPELQRYLAVPMLESDETVAILGVANREASYSAEDQRALTALADGVWRVLHSRRAHGRTMRSLQRTDVALQGMIDSFVRMSERHDPYTAGSSRRVAALAIALAREAGLDGERQHGLRVSALLHDIGNCAVPATILSKPAPLTETELALMHTHVEEGCQLLADIDFGSPVADIVYQHHERVDGSGYPRGLKGDEILLEARILAIADTVEAMCSPRPYRPAATVDAAIEEINRGAGRLYDLKLVAACTRLFRQHGFVLGE